MVQVHGTCVAVSGTGVLLLGPPGSGKSDLALRLIDGGARLVADDRVELTLEDGGVVASPPETIVGLLEVRGIGVLGMAFDGTAPLGLVVELAQAKDIERLPDETTEVVLGTSVPLVRLTPFEASAPAKVRLAVLRLQGHIRRVP